LNASISSRFTGPSHFASLAERATTVMANNWSRRPNMAATRAGLKLALVLKGTRMPDIDPESAA